MFLPPPSLVFLHSIPVFFNFFNLPPSSFDTSFSRFQERCSREILKVDPSRLLLGHYLASRDVQTLFQAMFPRILPSSLVFHRSFPVSAGGSRKSLEVDLSCLLRGTILTPETSRDSSRHSFVFCSRHSCSFSSRH